MACWSGVVSITTPCPHNQRGENVPLTVCNTLPISSPTSAMSDAIIPGVNVLDHCALGIMTTIPGRQ